MFCPHCKSKKIIPIFYGYPADEEEYLKLVAEKKIIPGGCVIENNSPKYFCDNCNGYFGVLEEGEILGEDSIG